MPAAATLVWLLSSRRAASILVESTGRFHRGMFIDDWCPAVLHWVLTIHVIPAEGSYVDLREGQWGPFPPNMALTSARRRRLAPLEYKKISVRPDPAGELAALPKHPPRCRPFESLASALWASPLTLNSRLGPFKQAAR